MKLTSKSLGALILVIFTGGILFSTWMNWWATTSTKEPVKFSEGEFAGLPNPADIRGSYTLGDIEKNFGIPLADLQKAFLVPAGTDVATYQVKNLETAFAAQAAEGKEIGTTSVRYYVALAAGLPFTVSGDIYLPSQAVDLLLQKAKLNPDQMTYLEAHRVTISTPASSTAVNPTPQAAVSTPVPSSTTATDRTIKGKTTFQDLLDWGVSKAAIEALIQTPLPASSTTLKDFASAKGLDFETLKTELQKAVDQVK